MLYSTFRRWSRRITLVHKITYFTDILFGLYRQLVYYFQGNTILLWHLIFLIWLLPPNYYVYQHFYDLSVWDGCWSLVYIWRLIYNFLSFWLHGDCGKWAGWAPKPQDNYAGCMTVVASVDRPKSVCNSCVIEHRNAYIDSIRAHVHGNMLGYVLYVLTSVPIIEH